MNVPVEFVFLNTFMEWFENFLNEKYDHALQGLKFRFMSLFNMLNQMIELLFEIHPLVHQDKQPQNSFQKILIDNCLQILHMIIQEYPKCIDLEFCEIFLDTINEKFDQFKYNFHPLTHIENPDQIIQKQFSKVFELLNDAIQKYPDIIEDIQKRVLLSVPLLKQIEDHLAIFKNPIKHLLDDFKDIKTFKIKQEYQIAFNEFLFQIQKENSKNSKGHFNIIFQIQISDCFKVIILGYLVKKMIQLIKESCMNQLQLETILDTPIKLSQLIKNRGKKLLNDDTKIETQNLLLKYINFMVKPDFISTLLSEISINELIFTIKTLESQKFLINELTYVISQNIRKQPMFLSGIDDVLFLNELEFRNIFAQWQDCNKQISELQNSQEFNEQFSNYKQSLHVSFVDVRKFSDKLWEYQKSLTYYHKFQNKFNRLKFQVQKYFLKNYQIRVQLICQDIL